MMSALAGKTRTQVISRCNHNLLTVNRLKTGILQLRNLYEMFTVKTFCVKPFT